MDNSGISLRHQLVAYYVEPVLGYAFNSSSAIKSSFKEGYLNTWILFDYKQKQIWYPQQVNQLTEACKINSKGMH